MGFTRVKKADGSCCECDQQVGCECTEEAGCPLQCRSKGGNIASLCGFVEFSTPSTPPKRYRRVDMSGTTTADGYPNNACSGDVSSTLSNEISGFEAYDKDNCELDSQGHLVTIENGSTIFSGPYSPITGPGCPGSDARFTWACTKTSAIVNGTGACVGLGISSSQICGGNNSYSLSDEDTEADAIKRADALIAEWGLCERCIDCPAFQTERGADDITFAYRSTQVRGTKVSPAVGHSYKITIGYYRRVLGSAGPWLPYAIDEQTITFTTPPYNADGSDFFTDWLDVPNEAGFETRAQTCTVEDVTLL